VGGGWGGGGGGGGGGEGEAGEEEEEEEEEESEASSAPLISPPSSLGVSSNDSARSTASDASFSEPTGASPPHKEKWSAARPPLGRPPTAAPLAAGAAGKPDKLTSSQAEVSAAVEAAVNEKSRQLFEKLASGSHGRPAPIARPAASQVVPGLGGNLDFLSRLSRAESNPPSPRSA